jgi:uncharacterized protein YgbK (DUF1537 family)
MGVESQIDELLDPERDEVGNQLELARLSKAVKQGVGRLVVAAGETSGACVQALRVTHLRELRMPPCGPDYGTGFGSAIHAMSSV